MTMPVVVAAAQSVVQGNRGDIQMGYVVNPPDLYVVPVNGSPRNTRRIIRRPTPPPRGYGRPRTRSLRNLGGGFTRRR